MAQGIKVGIIGGGWPGLAQARGFREAGGFRIVAVADLIPSRRAKLIETCGGDPVSIRAHADADALLADKEIEAVSVCLPTHLHAPIVLKALKSGKHVLCEKPPTLNAKEAKQLEAAATKYKRTLLYALQRRFGGAEQASAQALAKGYAGDVYHARASWMRTRGVPVGTGWFTDRAKSGGGALIDTGLPMLDLAWHLIGAPKPLSVYAVTQTRFITGVEDAAFALLRFENGMTLELSTSWAINQPPSQQGTMCRAFGTKGAVDVYTPAGAVLHRNFDEKGASKVVALKPPKAGGHVAMMRHFKQCIEGKATPLIGASQGVMLMQMIDAMYKSERTGKSVQINR